LLITLIRLFLFKTTCNQNLMECRGELIAKNHIIRTKTNDGLENVSIKMALPIIRSEEHKLSF